MKALLTRFLARKVELNANNSPQYETVTLVSVSDEFFTVRTSPSAALIHFPFHQISSVAETDDAVLLQVNFAQFGQYRN